MPCPCCSLLMDTTATHTSYHSESETVVMGSDANKGSTCVEKLCGTVKDTVSKIVIYIVLM